MRPLLVAIVAAAAVAAAGACADSKKWKLKIKKKSGKEKKLKCGDLTGKNSKYCRKNKKGKDKLKVKSACPKACGACEKRADKSTPCADSATFEYKGTACADLGNVAESSKDLKEICKEKGKVKLAAADACPEACGTCPGDDVGGDEGDSGGDVGGDEGDSGTITTTTQVITTTTQVALGPGSCDADTFFDVFDASANAVPADFCDRCCPGCAVHSGRAQLDFSAAAACVCYVGSVAGTESAAMANLELSAHGDCAAVDGQYFNVRGNGGDDRLIVFGVAPGTEDYSDYAAAVDGGDGDDFIDVRRSGYSVGGTIERLVVAGGAGDDEISATGSLLQLDGGEGDDEIHLLSGAVSSNNFVSGGGGNDVLDLEGVSQSIVFGGDGNDAITVVGDDNDQIDGGAGTDDVRVTGDYNDDLNGGDGDGDKLTLRGKQGTNGEIEGFEIENLYPSRA
jgi:hypothetical protein